MGIFLAVGGIEGIKEHRLATPVEQRNPGMAGPPGAPEEARQVGHVLHQGDLGAPPALPGILRRVVDHRQVADGRVQRREIIPRRDGPEAVIQQACAQSRGALVELGH